MPIAASGATSCCCWKKAMIRASVSPDVVVGKLIWACRSAGPVPTAQTILVPPASMPPYNIVLPVLLSPLLIDERITYYTYKSPSRRSFAALRMTFASTPLPCLLCCYRSLSLNLLLQMGENIQRTENSIYLISLRLDKHTHVSSSCPCK